MLHGGDATRKTQTPENKSREKRMKRVEELKCHNQHSLLY